MRRNPAQAVQTEAEAVSIGQMIVDLTEAEILLNGTRNGSKITRRQHLDGRRALRGSRLNRGSRIGTRISRCIHRAVRGEKVRAGHRGDRGKIPPRCFVIEEVEELVFDKRAAEADARLMANILGIERGITVTSVEAPIAEEPVAGTVNIVASAFRNRIHDTAHRLAIFRGKVVGDYLEFLDRLLGNRTRDTRSARVLVVVSISCVVSVCQKGIVTGDATKTEQTERTVRNHSRRHENK